MAKVTTELIDPEITIEHWIHRLDNGSYTYTTRTSYTTTEEITDAIVMAAELAQRADTLARKELLRRLTRDAETFNDPEVIELWSEVKERMERFG